MPMNNQIIRYVMISIYWNEIHAEHFTRVYYTPWGIRLDSSLLLLGLVKVPTLDTISETEIWRCLAPESTR